MTVVKLNDTRVSRAKRAFSTRRVLPSRMKTLIRGNVQPLSGDLVLARVDELGKQTKLELTDGRRAYMFPGDEVVVSFGNRYAPDQYEAVIGPDMSPCDLVAAGGIAGIEISRHEKMLPSTKITPIGLIGDAEGRRLNLMQFRVEAGDHLPAIPAILSLGTSMNAGKTLTATSMVRGLKRMGFSVAALKVTGTGAGGDMWIVRDAGADVALDFTDAGFATTYLASVPELERATFLLMNYAASLGCEIAVIEIADGLQQLETAQLIRSEPIKQVTLGTVFAAYDAMGAKYGVDVLREAGHTVFAISGRLGRSPLGVREAEVATGLRVYTPYEMQEGALVPAIRERAAERLAASSFRDRGMGRIAHAAASADIGLNGDAAAGALASPSVHGRRTNPQVLELLKVHWQTPSQAQKILERIAARIMHIEAERLCGAPFGKRIRDRVNRRNGFREATWMTVVGPVLLRIPRMRNGRYQPSFLDGNLGTRALRAEDVDAVLSTRHVGAIEAALSRLAAALGSELLDVQEIEVLVDDVRRLQAERLAPAALHAVPAHVVMDGRRSWFSSGADIDEEEFPVSELAPASGASRFFPNATDAHDLEEEHSIGRAFSGPRAVAGE